MYIYYIYIYIYMYIYLHGVAGGVAAAVAPEYLFLARSISRFLSFSPPFSL